jgi:thioredoxin-like negative regulator of GroEL
LLESLSERTRETLNEGEPGSKLAKRLAKDLNGLLEAGPLYDPARFAGIKLSDRTLRFVKEDPQSHTRIRLNRLLLEEAYPELLTKSLGGVYPDMEIIIASNEDSQRCFQMYLDDAQKRLDHDSRFPNEPRQIKPGEDVRIVNNKVTVSGQVAVMAINALLTKVMFDANPDREFYIEESFPLDWMYPYLSPYGIIMKINRNPLPALTQEMVDRDHEFWTQYSKRLIGNRITYDTTVSNLCAFAEQAYYRRQRPADFDGDPAFLRDRDAQKAFSKLRSSIAGVYFWRISAAKSTAEQQMMIREAEFAFKQAYAFCPYSPEALFRFINLLLTTARVDDALLLAYTSKKMDPFNAQIDNLIAELEGIRAQQGGQQQLGSLEAQYQSAPENLPLGVQLATTYFQSNQREKMVQLLDQIIANPKADGNVLTMAANLYLQVGLYGQVEQCLVKLLKTNPENPEGQYDLAAVLSLQKKNAEALKVLKLALEQSQKRLQSNPQALNLHAKFQNDVRFAGVRDLPVFKELLDSLQPK